MKRILLYQWVEDSLSSGEKVPEDMYLLNLHSHSHSHSQPDHPKPELEEQAGESKKIKSTNADADSNDHITQIFRKLIDIYRGQLNSILSLFITCFSNLQKLSCVLFFVDLIVF